MPYQIFWYVEQRVAYLEFLGEYALEEVIESSEKLRDTFLNVAEYPIHVICDLRGLKGQLHQIASICDACNIYLQHPSMGWGIFVGVDNPFVAPLMKVITSDITNFKTVSTSNEAHDILIEIDPYLAEGALKVISQKN